MDRHSPVSFVNSPKNAGLSAAPHATLQMEGGLKPARNFSSAI